MNVALSGWVIKNRVVLLTMMLFLFPVLIDLSLSGAEAVFRYSAPDSFYYHTIARNFANHGVFTYDGNTYTNGFHPLWQIFLGFIYLIVSSFGFSELSYLYTSIIFGALFITVSIYLIGQSLHNDDIRLGLEFLFIPFGFYSLLIAPYWLVSIDFYSLEHWSQGPFPLFGTLWSFVNGMESSVLILFWSLLAYFFIKKHHQDFFKPAIIGVLAALICLSRLDHGLLVLPFFFYYLTQFYKSKTKQAFVALVMFSLCFGLPILTYLITNYFYTESILPFSGVAKSSFPYPQYSNIENINKIMDQPFEEGRSMSSFYRMSQILIPFIFATIQLSLSFKIKKHSANSFQIFLNITSIGVILLALYNFFYVKTFNMGHWYFPVSIFFVSLCLIGWLKSNTKKRQGLQGLIIHSAILVLLFYHLHRRVDHHWLYAQMYLVEGPEVKAFYKNDFPKLIEVDDGIISFSTGFDSMSGTGLALDKLSFAKQQKGKLNEHAIQQGFDRVSTLVYRIPNDKNFKRGDLSRKDGAIAHINNFKKSKKYKDYQIEYISKSGYFWILKSN